MLYKLGGIHLVDGSKFDYIIVESEDVNAKLKDGWHLTPAAAQSNIDNSAPTRAELEIKAKELNIVFDGRTSDKKLEALINESLGDK